MWNWPRVVGMLGLDLQTRVGLVRLCDTWYSTVGWITNTRELSNLVQLMWENVCNFVSYSRANSALQADQFSNQLIIEKVYQWEVSWDFLHEETSGLLSIASSCFCHLFGMMRVWKCSRRVWRGIDVPHRNVNKSLSRGILGVRIDDVKIWLQQERSSWIWLSNDIKACDAKLLQWI